MHYFINQIKASAQLHYSFSTASLLHTLSQALTSIVDVDNVRKL